MTNVRALLEANGWTLEPTGGGCTAYTKPDDASWYWMMTRLDSPTAPELMTDPVTVGRYRLGGVGIGDVSDYSSLQLWAESHYLTNPEANAGPATSPEPSNPHPDHNCAENALRGNRCGICGAFLVAE